MTELMRTIYQYGTKARVSCGLDDYEQYCESDKNVEENLQKLRERLDPEGLRRLENYLGEQSALHDIELETAFCTGFSIGQELSRI